MLNTKKINRESIYLFGLILLVIGIPLSHVLMSAAQIIILANWIFDKRILWKIKLFYKNKPAFIFSLIFLLHIAGLFFTTDFEYAFKDLRTKVPILILPLILSSSKPLTHNNFQTILKWYIISIVFSSLVCILYFFTQKVDDIRNISVFISHIRFSLNICMAICILFYYLIIKKEYNKKKNIIISIVIAWLIFFIFILQSLTGIVILLFLATVYSIYILFIIKNINTKLIVIVSLLGFLFILFSFLAQYYHDYFTVDKIDFTQLEKKTPRGNVYEHSFTRYGIENGNYIGLYICKNELTSEWQKRSTIHIDSNDAKKQQIITTLIRFLNSKGLRKDADGIKALNDNEIKAIESGCANYLYINELSIKSRIYKILFEYNNYSISGTTKGYSIIQRYELWKAALGIIKEHFWFGVGTGDMVDAYQNQLFKMNSDLKDQKLRAHNQYLSVFSAFGIFGFCLFIFFYIYPAFKSKSFNKYLFVAFFIISSLSMINEDTIESQTGVTFFVFFYVLFILYQPDEKQIK